MNGPLAEHHDAIVALCEHYRVAQLDLVGSATSPDFDAHDSDFDFLVTFQPCTPAEHYDRYFGLVEDLEALLGRHVDLVESTPMRNPYFIAAVEPSRQKLYAA